MTGGQDIIAGGRNTGRPRDGRLLAWGVIGVISQAAFMAGWLIADTWQGPRYSPVKYTISDLQAATAPHAWFPIACFAAGGLGTFGFAVFGLRPALAGAGKAAWYAPWMLACSALALGNSFPLIPCRLADPGCTAHHQLVSPGGLTDAIVASIAFLVLALTPFPLWWRLKVLPQWRHLKPVMMAARVTGPVCFLLLGISSSAGSAQGLTERILATTCVLWICTLAITLITVSRHARAPAVSRTLARRSGENEQVAFELPVVDPASLSAWCELHLGSPAAGELFRAGHLACVIGARLADGREVVVKVRPAAPRTVACIEVQRRLFESGYPCPQPLAGPAPFGEYEATAESYVSGEVMLPASGRAAGPFAAALAQVVALAPSPEEVSSLAPNPPWTSWNHDQGGLWPWPEDQDLDLNEVDGPGWIDAAGQAARQRLTEGDGQAVIGHGDWWTENLRWQGNRLLVAYDWDSLITDSEAVIAGLAAAIYPALATVTETRDFLAVYAAARGRPFSPAELQRCWAAGVWTRAFDAKKQHAAGQPVISLTQGEAGERLRHAGMR